MNTVWRPEVNVESLSQTPITLYFETISHTELGAHQLARQTCQKALGIRPHASTSPAPAMWACIACLSFRVSSVGQTPILMFILQSLYQLSHLPISVFIKY